MSVFRDSRNFRKLIPPVFARLPDAEQHEIRGYSGLRDHAVGNLTVIGEALHCLLGGVVVPGYAVVLDEGKELVPTLQQPLPVALSHLRGVRRLRDALEEAWISGLCFPRCLLLNP